jgi:hypothetical protein
LTIKSGIFNSVNGDRKYKAEDFASYFAMFIANGVFPNPSTGFQVIANGDMTVSLKAGQAWINGYYITNDADYNMTIDVADGVLNRIDRVVLQLNYLNREITPIIKKGTFASSPVAPTLKRDADAYEIALADIYVGKGVLSITQTNITDLRLNNDLCGIVHGTVDQVDTTTIFNQYQSWFNTYSVEKSAEFEVWKTGEEQDFTTWKAEQQSLFESWKTNEEQVFSTWSAEQRADFDAWFLTIQDILDANTAGNLQNQITQLDADVGDITTLQTVEKRSITGALNEVNAELGNLEQTVSEHQAEDASLTQKGHVQLSNDTNSIDETKAATPKAVKILNDNLVTHLADKANPHNVTAVQVGAIPSNEKGQPGGVATLDDKGYIVQAQAGNGILSGPTTDQTYLELMGVL